MNIDEFKGRLARVQDALKNREESKDVPVGDLLSKKQQALRELEDLAQELETSKWDESQQREAVTLLLDLRQKIQHAGEYEGLRAQMGRVLSKTAGRKDTYGGTYSSQGRVKCPEKPPASRIDRIQ